MQKYSITNRNTCIDLGTYEADSEQGALEALARDAGYSSHADACEATGTDGSELYVSEVDEGTRYLVSETQNAQSYREPTVIRAK